MSINSRFLNDIINLNYKANELLEKNIMENEASFQTLENIINCNKMKKENNNNKIEINKSPRLSIIVEAINEIASNETKKNDNYENEYKNTLLKKELLNENNNSSISTQINSNFNNNSNVNLNDNKYNNSNNFTDNNKKLFYNEEYKIIEKFNPNDNNNNNNHFLFQTTEKRINQKNKVSNFINNSINFKNLDDNYFLIDNNKTSLYYHYIEFLHNGKIRYKSAEKRKTHRNKISQNKNKSM